MLTFHHCGKICKERSVLAHGFGSSSPCPVGPALGLHGTVLHGRDMWQKMSIHYLVTGKQKEKKEEGLESQYPFKRMTSRAQCLLIDTVSA